MHRFTRNFGISCSGEFSPRKTQAARPAASHFLTNTRNPNENNAMFICTTYLVTRSSPACRKTNEHCSQTAGRISVIDIPFCSAQRVLSKKHTVNCTDRRNPKILNKIPRKLIEKSPQKTRPAILNLESTRLVTCPTPYYVVVYCIWRRNEYEAQDGGRRIFSISVLEISLHIFGGRRSVPMTICFFERICSKEQKGRSMTEIRPAVWE